MTYIVVVNERVREAERGGTGQGGSQSHWALGTTRNTARVPRKIHVSCARAARGRRQGS